MQSHFAEHTLPNGLRIVCETMPNVRSAAVGFLVRTGSRHETTELHGVSHFLEHMCFKGTPKRNWRDINVRFDDLGSLYNAFTGKEHTVYYGWVPADRMEPQLELLSDMMRPSLPADDYETERKVILEEIAMNDDSFDRHVSNFLHRVLFQKHPLAHEILGEKEAIEVLPRDAMATYHARRYHPRNMVLLASGAVEAEELFASAARYCAHWDGASNGQYEVAAAPEFEGVHKLKLDRFKQQSLVLLCPAPAYGLGYDDTIHALCGIFGGHNSRCFWNIVQKGICTSAGVVWLSYADCGALAFYADGEPGRCEEMIEALQSEMNKLIEKGVTRDEVGRITNQRVTQLALESENPRTRFMQLVDDMEERRGVRTVAARLAGVKAVTPAGIRAYLREFPIAKTMLISCGPRDWPS